MDDLLLNKVWFRCPDGYRLEKSSERNGSQGGQRIVAHSFNIVNYRPFAEYDMLWSAFAQVKSASDLLAFIRNFGALELHGTFAIESEHVERALTWAGEFRALLAAKAIGPRKVARVFRTHRLR